VIEGDLGEGGNKVDDFVFVGRGVVADAVEEFVEVKFVEHVAGVGIVEGGDAERDILEGFDEDAADTDHDDGAEEEIAF